MQNMLWRDCEKSDLGSFSDVLQNEMCGQGFPVEMETPIFIDSQIVEKQHCAKDLNI